MAIDPYSSPAAIAQPPPYAGDAAVTSGAIQQLAGTKPWVRFISVMLLIGAALMLAMALVMGLAGGIGIPQAQQPGMGAGFVGVMAAIYGVIALLYIYPAVKLWKYASAIGNLIRSGQSLDLEQALNQQRGFWKFVGIAVAVMLALYVVGIVLLAVGGFAALKTAATLNVIL